jgi:hypothetical protein
MDAMTSLGAALTRCDRTGDREPITGHRSSTCSDGPRLEHGDRAERLITCGRRPGSNFVDLLARGVGCRARAARMPHARGLGG